MAPQTTVDYHNSLPISAYRSKLFACDTRLEFIEDGITKPLAVGFESAETISNADFDACFNLIASTSSAIAKASSMGWSPAKKRKEMRLPDMRYILLSNPAKAVDGEGKRSQLQGFLSFMLTYEDDYEVIYCYELHLGPKLRRQGLGRRLMELMERVGDTAGVQKAMLTVFKDNSAALNFYEEVGYGEDEYSPRPRKLRKGVVKEPDYAILSKPLAENPQKVGRLPRGKRKRGDESRRHVRVRLAGFDAESDG